MNIVIWCRKTNIWCWSRYFCFSTVEADVVVNASIGTNTGDKVRDQVWLTNGIVEAAITKSQLSTTAVEVLRWLRKEQASHCEACDLITVIQICERSGCISHCLLLWYTGAIRWQTVCLIQIPSTGGATSSTNHFSLWLALPMGTREQETERDIYTKEGHAAQVLITCTLLNFHLTLVITLCTVPIGIDAKYGLWCPCATCTQNSCFIGLPLTISR